MVLLLVVFAGVVATVADVFLRRLLVDRRGSGFRIREWRPRKPSFLRALGNESRHGNSEASMLHRSATKLQALSDDAL